MQTIKKIQTVEDALSVFEHSTVVHGEATKQGNYKVGNKAYDRIIKAVSFLRQGGNEALLYRYLQHEKPVVRITAAFTLRSNEENLIKVLGQAGSCDDILAHGARHILSQWRAGKLMI